MGLSREEAGIGRSGRHALDAAAVKDAYRRWAGIYDRTFGGISAAGRRSAVAAANATPGAAVLEVGVGTGLSLPLYAADKRVTGIDLSAHMLRLARQRVAAQGLGHVVGLHERDAEDTGLDAGAFDVAVAMFVASVVPNPRRLLAEMRRVVRPGGTLIFVNHFRAETGPRLWVERAMAPASRGLGWHPDFALDALLPPEQRAAAQIEPVPPFGLFTLVRLGNC